MASKSVLSFNLAAFAIKCRLIPDSSRLLYIPFKHSQFSRRCSSIKEERMPQKGEAAQDLQLSDSCVKVG